MHLLHLDIKKEGKAEIMVKIKQQADIEASKFTYAICREGEIDAVILDIYKVKPETMGNIQSIPRILKDLAGARLITMEPIGGGADFLEGLILYFMLPNGDQRAIEIDPNNECIGIQFYKADVPERSILYDDTLPE